MKVGTAERMYIVKTDKILSQNDKISFWLTLHNFLNNVIP